MNQLINIISNSEKKEIQRKPKGSAIIYLANKKFNQIQQIGDLLK